MVDFNADWERLDDLIRWGPTHRHRRRLILGLCRHLEFRNVLDVGCGNGELAMAVHERFGATVTGLDRSERVIRMNRRRSSEVRFLQGDIERRPPAGTYDLVVCTELLEHVESDQAALRHMRAACRGHLIVSVPGGAMRATDREFGHLRHYTLRSLESALVDAGFDPLRCFGWGFPLVNAYKAVVNWAPNLFMRAFCGGRYGPLAKGWSRLVYALFHANVKGPSGPHLYAMARPRVRDEGRI